MSWPTVKFSDLIGPSGVFTDGDWVESKDQDAAGDVRLIQLADIGVAEFLNKSNRYMTTAKANELKCTFLEPGDILIARMPDPIGRACIFPKNMGKCVTVVDVCVVRPNNRNVYCQWLKHLVNSDRFKSQIIKHVTGTTRQRISRGNLATLDVQIPSIEEQKRIAAILDKADAIRRKRQQAIKLADDFLRSVFLDMFGDPVTNPKGWEEHPLYTLAEIQSGVTKGKKVDIEKSKTLPYIRVANVQDGYLDLSEIKYIVVSQSDAKKYLLKPGDLLLTEGGDPDKLGRGYIWNGEVDQCLHQNHIFSVRIKISKSEIIRPQFLSAIVSSLRGKRYFLKVGKQTTGIATINKTVLSDFSVLLPPVNLQDEYIAICKKVVAMKDTLAMGDLNLMQSCQQSLFSNGAPE